MESLSLGKRRKDGNCRTKEEHESLEARSQKYKMGTHCVKSILFLSLYLLHTWSGELNLEEYCKTLREVDENMQDIKQKFHISGIIAGVDAQVEVKPHQEPFVGGGRKMYLGNNTKYCEMEAKFESLLMDWITKHDVKLTNNFSK